MTTAKKTKTEVGDVEVRVTVRKANLRTKEDKPTTKVNVAGRMVKKAPVIEGSVNGERFAYECDRSHTMPFRHADVLRSGGWVHPDDLAESLAEATGQPKKKPAAKANDDEAAITAQAAKKKMIEHGIDREEVEAMSADDAIAIAAGLD